MRTHHNFFYFALIAVFLLIGKNLYGQPSVYFKGSQGRSITRGEALIARKSSPSNNTSGKTQNGQIVSQAKSPDGSYTVSLLKNASTQPYDAKSEVKPTDKIHCLTESRRVTATDEESFLMQPQQHVFPGSAIDGNSIPRGEYSMIRHELNPIYIRVDGLNLADHNMLTQKIEAPTAGNITSTLARMVNSPKAGVQRANYISKFEEVKSNEEFSIALGVQYSGLTNQFSGLFSSNTSKSKRMYVMEFSQIYYTVFADIPASSKDFFKTYKNDIPESWMYISEVNYGRKGILLIVIENENSDISVSGSYTHEALVSSGGAQLSSSLKNSSSKINVYGMIKGGNPVDAAAINTANWELNIKNFFNFFQKGAVFDKNNPAYPLSFVMRFINDPNHGIGRIEQTLSYQRNVCDDLLKFRIGTVKIEGVKIDDGRTGGDAEELYGRISFSVNLPSGNTEGAAIWDTSPYPPQNTGYVAVKRGAVVSVSGKPQVFSIPPENMNRASVTIKTDGALPGSNARRGVFEYDPKSSDETYTAMYIPDIRLTEILSLPNRRKEFTQTFKQGSTSEVKFVYFIELLNRIP